MKLVLIGLLVAGCGGAKSAAPKLDCDVFSKHAVTGLIGTTATPVLQSAKDECEAGSVTQKQYDCVIAATTKEAVGDCMKKP